MTATDPTTTLQPADFARERAILRWAADRIEHLAKTGGLDPRVSKDDLLRRWADELDAAPAVYTLPPEPPDGTRLKDRGGGIWQRDGRYIATWTLVVTFRGETPYAPVRRHWHELLMAGAPLMTAPPAGTEGDDA